MERRPGRGAGSIGGSDTRAVIEGEQRSARREQRTGLRAIIHGESTALTQESSARDAERCSNREQARSDARAVVSWASADPLDEISALT